MDTQQELIEGLLQYVTLAEGERKLLAADLHDQTLSDLRELAQLARRLSNKLRDASPAEVRDGLVQLTRALKRRWTKSGGRWKASVPRPWIPSGCCPPSKTVWSAPPPPASGPLLLDSHVLVEDQITLSEIEQLLIYRIVQEALNNISKHAAARSVDVLIARTGAHLFIRVTDDGEGMIASGDLRRARGLENMRYRARLIGAQITWLRATGDRGTVVEVRVPMQRF